MWIIATEVRTGTVSAFPAATTIVTFDRRALERARSIVQHASHPLAGLQQVFGSDAPEGLSEAVSEHDREMAKMAKTMQTAEALLTLVSGGTLPVRDVEITTDFDVVRRRTGGAP